MWCGGLGKEMWTLPVAVVKIGHLAGVAESAGAHPAVTPLFVVIGKVHVRDGGALIVEGASTRHGHGGH